MCKCSQVMPLLQGTHSSGGDQTASGLERAMNLSPLSTVQEAGIGRSAKCCRSTEEVGFVLPGNTKEGFDKGGKQSTTKLLGLGAPSFSHGESNIPP